MLSSMSELGKNHHYLTLPRSSKHRSLTKELEGLSLDDSDEAATARTKKTSPKSIAAVRNEDWKALQNSITYLFTKKRLYGLELDTLNEKVRNVRDSMIGQFIVEYYKDSILKKGKCGTCRVLEKTFPPKLKKFD